MEPLAPFRAEALARVEPDRLRALLGQRTPAAAPATRRCPTGACP